MLARKGEGKHYAVVEKPNREGGRVWEQIEKEFWSLFLLLMLAAAIAVLALWAGTAQRPSWEWLWGVGLSMLTAFLAWVTGYFSMLSSERKRNGELREANIIERQRADEAQRRADEFFPKMMALLEQIAANTDPNRPGQPDRSAPEPDSESITPW